MLVLGQNTEETIELFYKGEFLGTVKNLGPKTRTGFDCIKELVIVRSKAIDRDNQQPPLLRAS